MARIIFNDRLDAALCALFMFVVVSVLVYSVRAVLQARASREPTARETPFAALPAGAAVSDAHPVAALADDSAAPGATWRRACA